MTTAPRLLVVLFIALLLTSCGGDNRYTTPRPTPTPLSDVINAQATQIYSGAASQVAIAQATYVAEQSAIRATAEYQATDAAINATISAHDIGYLPTRAAIQATIDAARAGEAQARLDSAQINLQIAKRGAADAMTISQLNVISATNAVTTTAALRQHDLDKSNDFWYSVTDYISRWIPLAAFAVGAFCLLWIVRAVAARLAGDRDRAMLVLGYAMHPALLPPAPAEYVENDRETPEHGNTGNTGNTPNNTGNTPISTVFPVYHQGNVTYMPRMSAEERDALLKAKTTAIRILQAAAEWNQAHRADKDYDPARISRYDDLGVKAEDRGEVCGMLEALNPAAVSIKKGGKGQGTFVTPEYGSSVIELLKAIMSNDVRLYPAGFRSEAIQAAETLNSAVNALPGVTR